MSPLPPKKEVALALLERSSVHIHLDPRAEGVTVPMWFKKQPQLVLQIGLNMPTPIPDLRLDEEGMSCTLSFSRSPFFCVVPWRSVYAMVGDDGRGMVWPDDVPPEVANQAHQARRDGDAAVKKPAAKRPAPVGGPVGGRAKEARAEGEAAGVGGAGAAGGPAAKQAGTSPPRQASLGIVSSGPSGAKPKKPKKRGRLEAGRPNGGEAESPARANLVAVPSAAPSSPKSPPQPALQPSQAATADAGQAAPRVAPADRRPSPPRPKRELPPYLRVVK
jgi:stringent starvation protein B